MAAGGAFPAGGGGVPSSGPCLCLATLCALSLHYTERERESVINMGVCVCVIMLVCNVSGYPALHLYMVEIV